MVFWIPRRRPGSGAGREASCTREASESLWLEGGWREVCLQRRTPTSVPAPRASVCGATCRSSRKERNVLPCPSTACGPRPRGLSPPVECSGNGVRDFGGHSLGDGAAPVVTVVVIFTLLFSAGCHTEEPEPGHLTMRSTVVRHLRIMP